MSGVPASSSPHRWRQRCRGHIERLERRTVLASDLSNPFNPLDVDDDGWVAPADVLVVVNRLNGDPASGAAAGSYTDVNGDGQTAPLDALLVVNHLVRYQDSRPGLVFWLSPQDDPNGNGVVLRDTVTLRGQTLPHGRVRLSGARQAPGIVTADAAGHFQTEVRLAAGENVLRLAVVDDRMRSTVSDGVVRVGDVVLDWNASLLNVVRDWTSVSNDPYPNRIVTSQPPAVARNLAMIHAAMFDAVNAMDQEYEPYRFRSDGAPDASPVAAAAAAAHRVATALYREPDERAVFDAALAEALATVPDGRAEQLGIELGREVGDAILAWRTGDGSGGSVSHTPGLLPGEWKRTFPDYYPPLLPQWPRVMPFAMSSPSQFRPAPPPSLDSDEYAAAVEEVMQLGGLDSTSRTADQTNIALFWADGGGTATPPGHWNQIAADAAILQGTSMVENARLFAMLNIALADAGISSWDAKYAYNFWRPVDAVREADRDGNPRTVAYPTWTPLLRTPPFPSYTSGHSSFSGAANAVLDHIFGSNFHFTSRSDSQSGFTQRPLAADKVTTRSFRSFTEAAEEASRSRIYGGIHYEFDSRAGLEAGRAIGNLVVATIALRRT